MTDATVTEVVERFIRAFQERDPSLIPEIVADGCVMEGAQPAPEGLRVVGRADNVRFWQAMVSDASGAFESEEVIVLGERAINRWRYRWGEADGDSLRGVTLFRIVGGEIVEALAYAKTMPALGMGTAEIIRRFNDAFQKRDPAQLRELVHPDCVIENTSPSPDGARIEGRAACVRLWSEIATAPRTRFELEEVVTSGDLGIIYWRLHYGDDLGASVRGVNIMRVRDGLIVEARGYLKSG